MTVGAPNGAESPDSLGGVPGAPSWSILEGESPIGHWALGFGRSRDYSRPREQSGPATRLPQPTKHLIQESPVESSSPWWGAKPDSNSRACSGVSNTAAQTPLWTSSQKA